MKRFVKFILITAITLTLLSCSKTNGPIRSGIIITLEGDTIEFYGGYLRYSGWGYWSINSMGIKDYEKGD